MAKGNSSPNGTQPSRFKLIEAADLKLLPPVRLLGSTHIVAEGLNVIFGPSGSYKSFYTLDTALRLAQSSVVVYVAAEGASGFQNRVEAWCEHHQVGAGQLKFITEEVNLLDSSIIAEFAHTLKSIKKPIHLVIFDTYARCMPGGDENSAKDAGLAIRHCAKIQRAFKTAVAVVHHSNRAETGERGSGALRGAADMMIEVNAPDDVIRVSCEKAKDWEAWPAETYRFQPVGKSGLLLPADDVHLPDRITNFELRILEALDMLIFEMSGATVQQVVDTTGLSRSLVYKLLNKMKGNDLVTQDKRGNPFRLSDEGRDALYRLKPMLKKQDFNITVDVVN